ncbi:YveK family protein [Microbacteriaceae bacterium 4G12]
MEETISLKEVAIVLRKRLSMILSITFLAALISAIVSFYFMTPIYSTSTQILVNQKKAENTAVQFNEVQTSVQLVNTYSVIIKSPAILEKVKENMNLDMSVQQLNSKINVASEKNSQVFSLTVQDSDPGRARDIANTTAKVFKDEIAKIMSVDNVTIISQADIAKSPVKPRPALNIAIAIVVGLMVSVGISFLIEYLDNTLKKEEDIEAYLGLPVLGAISHMEESSVSSANAAIKKVRGQTVGS